MSMITRTPSPSRSLRRLSPFWDEPFNNFFKSGFPDLWSGGDTETIPSVNVIEESNQYVVEMAAPGLKRDDFSVKIENNVLTISCEKEIENKPEKESKAYSRREYNYSYFSRSFTIPDNIKAEEIMAKYENGVLILNLPKKFDKKEISEKKIKVQ